MDVTDTYRTCCPTTAEYTFFLGHKASLNKFQKTEIILSMFSDHNDMKLEIHNRRKTEKITNMWKSNTLLNNQ